MYEPEASTPPRSAGALRTVTPAIYLAGALLLTLGLGVAEAATPAGLYTVSVKATLTPDYVYTKTTDAPDFNLVILVNKKIVYSAADQVGYKTLDSAAWVASFPWKPGDQVGLRLMDADTFSSDTVVELEWAASNTMPLTGTADLAKILGFTATGCSITFEVIATPRIVLEPLRSGDAAGFEGCACSIQPEGGGAGMMIGDVAGDRFRLRVAGTLFEISRVSASGSSPTIYRSADGRLVVREHLIKASQPPPPDCAECENHGPAVVSITLELDGQESTSTMSRQCGC